MSEYRLDFPIQVGSVEPVKRVADAFANVEKAGTRATTTTQAYDRANDKLSKTIADLQRQFAQHATAIKNSETATASATTSTDRYTRSVTGLGDAHRKAVTDVQAASAAIRGLEGHLSIRAVEQFTVKMLGLGNVMQAVFPIVGGLAFVGMLEQMVGKVGELYNTWNPLLRAQRESLAVMKELASLDERQFSSKQKLIVQEAAARAEAQRKGTGRIAALNTEASQLTSDAQYGGVEIGGVTYTRGYLTNKIDELRKKNAGPRPTDTVQSVFGIRTTTTNPARLAYEANEEEIRRYSGYLERVDEQASINAREAGLKRIEAGSATRDLNERYQREYNRFARGANRLEDSTELGKTSTGRLVQSGRAFIESLNESELSAPDKAAIRSRYVANFGPRLQSEVGTLITSNTRAMGRYVESEGRASTRAELFDDRLYSQSLRDQREELQKGVHADEQIRNIQTGSERSDIMHRATRQGRISQLSFGPGDEVAAINNSYNQRIALAQTLKGIEESAALKELDLNQQRVFLAKSEADFRKISQEAALDREEKILELRKKQQEEFAHTVEGGFRALVSGGGRGLANFARGQVTNIGATIAGNAGRMVYSRVAGSLNIPGLNPNSGIGQLLKGTPFVSNDPGSKLLTAGDSLQTAATALVGAAGALSGGGTSLVPGMVGVTPGMIGGAGGIGGLAGMIGPGGTSGFGGPLGKLFGGGFGMGLASFGTANMYNILRGRDASVETSHGTDTLSNTGALSTSSRAGAAVGAGTAILAGGVTAYRAFSRGNTLGGIGAIAGTAAALDPEPISKAILTAASTVISLFGGDPKERRSNQINKNLANGRFYDPTAINVSAGMNGGLSDYDRYGNVRGSDVSPYPTTEAPYMDYRNNTYVPGRVVSNYGGSGPGMAPTVNVNINAIDSGSILDRHQDITDAVTRGLQNGAGSGFVDQLRQQL